jgi:hypothetical protein
MAGYSKTPLAKKLGIKEGFRVRIKNPPCDYCKLVAPLPNNVTVSLTLRTDIDLWHLFTRSSLELRAQLPKLLGQIRQNGAIWVSWPKKSSGEPTDVSGDEIRAAALPLGLVDVKVCAVDDVWSGLKLMIRKKNRKKV